MIEFGNKKSAQLYCQKRPKKVVRHVKLALWAHAPLEFSYLRLSLEAILAEIIKENRKIVS